MYTTPLSTLIFSLAIYADDTQLFFSFHTLNFDSSICYLQNALQQIFSWMTANLLTLNSCKTEFWLIGLKNKLAKIHTLHLTLPTVLENLPSFLTIISPSLTKLHLSPKHVIITFSIRQLPVPLLPLSSTPNLITAILSTINSLNINYLVSSLSRTLSSYCR